MCKPLVSILINNYNYGRFLRDAIDSALHQTYSPTEVIVVDDGSTDHSRDIIRGYRSHISSVLQQNSGQAAAFNAGVRASRGDIVCFLDADDFFYPGKVERVVQTFEQYNLETKLAMVHHLANLTNKDGLDLSRPSFGRRHRSPLNLYNFAKRHRFIWYEAGPTSTIALSRQLTDYLFPIPEKGGRVAADGFVAYGALLLADVYSLNEALCGYRIHGNNNFYGGPPRHSANYIQVLQDYLNSKLADRGLQPILSYEDSMCAWPRMRVDRRWGSLALHMLKICWKDHDIETLTYAYHTAMESCMSVKKAVRRRL